MLMMTICGVILALAVAGFGWMMRAGQGVPRPQRGGAGHPGPADRGGLHRDPDHGGHRAVAGLQHDRVLPALSGVGDFFFGTDLGAQLLGPGRLVGAGRDPALWGTLYISLIALLVAVPIGLFSAIYLSEYASPRCAPLPSR
jgi:hypothetical protein